MKWDQEVNTTPVKPQEITRQLKDKSEKQVNGFGVDLRDLGGTLQTTHSNPGTGFWRRSGKGAAMITAIWLLFTATAAAEIAPDMVTRIVDAIYLAEGGAKAKYGIKSVSCDSLTECRRICENTVRNNYRRWLKTDQTKPFLVFLRDRYAPVEVHPLNRNWLRNVEMFLYGGRS